MFFRKKKIRLHAGYNSHVDVAYRSGQKPGFKLSAKRFFDFQKKNLKTQFPKFQPNSREILAFLFIALSAWALLQSARLGAIVLAVKQKISISAGLGAGYLQEAKIALADQDLNLASAKFTLAVENFKSSGAQLAGFEKSLLGVTKLLAAQKDADNLLQASLSLAEAGEAAVKFANLAKNFSFGAQGLLRGEAGFDDLADELDTFSRQLKLAGAKIKATNLNSLPKSQRTPLAENLSKISDAISSAENLKQLIVLGQTFLSGESRVLLLLENNNELRPTGGFIGSFGSLLLDNGKIQRLKISSIYDLDGQLTEKIFPPTPVLAVNDRWFLRDANWFSSFDLSAKKIMTFYEKEGGETPDLIIALTPTAIGELLKITGPLEMSSGLQISQENLTEQLQILTQSDVHDPSNEPKKILGELYVQLFQKIGSLQGAQKAQGIIAALEKSLVNKQILFYARANPAQKIFEAFNWAGKIAKADRDYLLITSANLGGTKTDLAIEQKISLDTEISPGGKIINTLRLTRTNTLPDLPGAQNKSFLRIYVPQGSQFLESQGFDVVNLERPQSQGYKTDADVFEWEKSSVKDVVSGTLIGSESGKTFFGNWVILAPGETKSLVLKYVLPFQLKTIDRFSLVLQKQPGGNESEFEYKINLAGLKPEWLNFNPRQTDAKAISLRALLNKDQFFGMVLRK